MLSGSESLRRVAVLGTVAVLLGDLVRSWPIAARQWWALAFLFLAIGAVGGVIWWLMGPAWRKLAKSPDMLVPLGLLTLAGGAIDWFSRVPGVALAFGASKEIKYGAMSFGTLSLGWFFGFVFALMYAAWATRLILDAEFAGQPNVVAAFRPALRQMWRVLGIILIMWVGLTTFLAVEFSTIMAVGAAGPSLGRFGAVVVGALLLGFSVLAYLGNLATAALLPVALLSSRGFLASFVAGIATSWRGRRFWWHLVLVQLLLLGFWVFMTYNYSHSKTSGATMTESFSYSFNFRFHHFWAGGFDSECRWYGEFMKAVGAKPVAVIGRLLGLLLGVLALVVKLSIVGRLPRSQPTPSDQPVVDPPAAV